MTTNQTRYEQFAQTDDTTDLSEGDQIIGPVDQQYEVIDAGPFEVYAENTLTQQRMSIDMRDISDGPYEVA